MSQRTDRVASTIARAVREVLARGLEDPRARGMITVTSVTVSQDLRSATVYVSVYPHEHEKLTLHALTHAAAHIRRQAGDLVALPQLPRLLFKLDAAIKAQAQALTAIAKAAAELRSKDETQADLEVPPGGEASSPQPSSAQPSAPQEDAP